MGKNRILYKYRKLFKLCGGIIISIAMLMCISMRAFASNRFYLNSYTIDGSNKIIFVDKSGRRYSSPGDIRKIEYNGNTVWIAGSTVTYNANGGAWQGNAGTYTEFVNYGENALSPSKGKPSRSGYAFAGWATSSTGSKLSAKSADGTDFTLYALWTPVNMASNFDFIGAYIVSDPSHTYSASGNTYTSVQDIWTFAYSGVVNVTIPEGATGLQVTATCGGRRSICVDVGFNGKPLQAGDARDSFSSPLPYMGLGTWYDHDGEYVEGETYTKTYTIPANKIPDTLQLTCYCETNSSNAYLRIDSIKWVF